MNKKNAFNEGFNNGYGIASENLLDYLNPDLFTNIDLNNFITMAITHESEIYRQYSPFEVTAKEINESRYPDEVWQSYENGVMAGIAKRIKEFKKANKEGYIKLE